MSADQELCQAFCSSLSAWLDGQLAPDRAAALAEHEGRCPACAAEAGVARATDRLLRRWQVPSPPAGFAVRAVARIEAEPAGDLLAGGALAASSVADETVASSVGCSQFALLLGDYLDRSVALPMRRAIEQHAASCGGCADQLRLASEAEQLFQRWTVPDPPRGFADRVLARIANDRPLARGPAWRKVPAILLPLAAAVLGILFLAKTPPSERGPTRPDGESAVEIASATPEFTSSNPLWPIDTNGLGADALTRPRAPLGETFLRSLQRVSHRPGR